MTKVPCYALNKSSQRKQMKQNNISETRQVPSVLLQNHTLPAILASAGPRNHAPPSTRTEKRRRLRHGFEELLMG